MELETTTYKLHGQNKPDPKAQRHRIQEFIEVTEILFRNYMYFFVFCRSCQTLLNIFLKFTIQNTIARFKLAVSNNIKISP